ncbi:DUF2634 domain-containing protein [Aneurinibacillus sp. BA2021]|nr:DUF2634 domain-containing protein [Aneurinibacillus sp. BA2021]
MADEIIPLFPNMELDDLEELELYEEASSTEKWTYVIDFRNRCAVFDTDGRPLRTKTYAEYLIQTALRILNTERFQYAIYSENIGVEKSEWATWEDIEIRRDMEEALAAHSEIEQAEVVSIERNGSKVYVRIRLIGRAGTAELEEVLGT